MCIGVPMRIVEICGASAWCEGRGSRRLLNTLMLDTPAVGSWVLSSLGLARQLLTPEDAALINAALDELEGVMRNDFEARGPGPSGHAGEVKAQPFALPAPG
jgi:hydrogenase expression/formation protein HypC